MTSSQGSTSGGRGAWGGVTPANQLSVSGQISASGSGGYSGKLIVGDNRVSITKQESFSKPNGLALSQSSLAVVVDLGQRDIDLLGIDIKIPKGLSHRDRQVGSLNLNSKIKLPLGLVVQVAANAGKAQAGTYSASGSVSVTEQSTDKSAGRGTAKGHGKGPGKAADGSARVTEIDTGSGDSTAPGPSRGLSFSVGVSSSQAKPGSSFNAPLLSFGVAGKF